MADGKVTIGTEIDTSGAQAGLNDVKKKVASISASIRKTLADLNLIKVKPEADTSKAQKELQELERQIEAIKTENKIDVDIDATKIQNILNDTEKSSKSKAASIASIFKKAGMDSSSAFKNAWDLIERESDETSTKVKENTKKIPTTFKESMAEVKSIVKSAMKIVAGYFSVRAIVNFGKQAVEAASDLQEVQNVVDTAFGNMGYKMEQFADKAIKTYGISKLTAKRTGSTYMAMAKGMGIAANEASNMALDLTGLSADMASFYNVSQDIADTALKSVFTGETETLKQFGIVMTQANLQQFAYQQGIKKSIQKMTQAEQVQLRYNYVMQQTQLAQGDFARTQNSWANQTRILSETWKEFIGVIGSGLLIALTPIVRTLNTIMSQLLDIANMISDIFGWDPNKQAKGVKDTSKALNDQAKAANKATSATKKNEKATKKAAKTAKGSVGSFDELVLITTESADASDKAAKAQGGSGGADPNTKETAKQSEKLSAILDAVKKKFLELKNLFLQGFKLGLGDWKPSVENIKASIAGIKQSLKTLFTDPALLKSINNFVNQVALTLGKITGSVSSIILTITDLITGGIDRYLSENLPYIKDTLISIIDSLAEMVTQIGDVAVAIADIFTVFRGDTAKEAVSNLIGIFSNAVLGITEIVSKLGRDVLKMITQPIIDNKDKLKDAIENTLKPINTILETLNESVKETFEKLNTVYDEHIKPLFDSITEGLSDILGTWLDAYNDYIAPVLDKLAKKFKKVWKGQIQPTINKAIDLIGSVADTIKVLWENVLQPVIKWVGSVVIKTLAPVLQTIGDLVMNVIGIISDILGGIFDILKDILDFITAVFEGDWKKAWQSIKNIVSDVISTIGKIIKDLISTVEDVFKDVAKTIEDVFDTAIKSVKGLFKDLASWFKKHVKEPLEEVFSNIADWFKDKFDNAWKGIKEAFGNVKEFFSDVWSKIKSAFQPEGKTIPEWFKDKFSGAWEKIKSVFNIDNVKEFFSKVWDGIKSPFGSIADWFKDKFSDAWQKVKDVFSSGGKVFDGIKDGILKGLKAVINTLIKGINTVIKIPFEGINFALKKIKGISILGKKPFDFISTIDIPQIPKLATGAVIPPNKEFLAMLGDQKSGTNIEAPLDTITQAFREVMASYGGGQQGDIIVQIDGREVFRAVRSQANDFYNRTGNPAFTV